MPPRDRFRRLTSTFREFPSQYWILVAAAFIDRLGGAMLFPFFTLYLTKKFGIGMTEVGMLFAMFALTSVLGSFMGGALTDRFGRKGMLIFGLVMSAASSLLMGVIDSYALFILVIPAVGLLADAGGPAQQALVADLLPEEKRAEGFGILRVVFNLAVTIGPLIGGLLAVQSYLLLFIVDAATSLVTAGVAWFALKETWKPKPAGANEENESLLASFKGYGVALRDRAFLGYLLASMLMTLVYMNMNTTLSVYLRDNHTVSEQGFSYILSLNAAMVVLFQFAITRRLAGRQPMLIMSAGSLLYAVGFAMYGFVNAFWLFLAAMAIITIGEMFVSPTGQAIVVRLAPETMRGRYMAAYGFSWVLPMALGPLLAGFVLDNLEPDWLWYICGLVGVLAAGAFYGLEKLGDRARWAAVDRRLRVVEQLEVGVISAETASHDLQSLEESPWVRLGRDEPRRQPHRHLRVRVTDLADDQMKVDLRLPIGLVNTVLVMGGQFSADLDPYDSAHLRALIEQSLDTGDARQSDQGSQRVDIGIED